MAAFRSVSELQTGTGCSRAIVAPTAARIRSACSSPATCDSDVPSASMKIRECGGLERRAAAASVIASNELLAGRTAIGKPVSGDLIERGSQE